MINTLIFIDEKNTRRLRLFKNNKPEITCAHTNGLTVREIRYNVDYIKLSEHKLKKHVPHDACVLCNKQEISDFFKDIKVFSDFSLVKHLCINSVMHMLKCKKLKSLYFKKGGSHL